MVSGPKHKKVDGGNEKKHHRERLDERGLHEFKNYSPDFGVAPDNQGFCIDEEHKFHNF